MTDVDCVVSRVLGAPYRKFGHWWLDVLYSARGSEAQTHLMFSTEAAALAIQPGHVFQS